MPQHDVETSRENKRGKAVEQSESNRFLAERSAAGGWEHLMEWSCLDYTAAAPIKGKSPLCLHSAYPQGC